MFFLCSRSNEIGKHPGHSAPMHLVPSTDPTLPSVVVFNVANISGSGNAGTAFSLILEYVCRSMEFLDVLERIAVRAVVLGGYDL